MIIKNVKADWLFINRPDENGKYRLSFNINKEQYDVLYQEALKVAETNNVKIENLTWYMGYKQNEETGQQSVSCKANHKYETKSGEEVTFNLPVYNKKAERFNDDEIPFVANGAIINVEVDPYFVKYKGKTGIMLNLKSVQLLDYKEYNVNPYEDETGENPYNSPKIPNINISEDDEVFK